MWRFTAEKESRAAPWYLIIASLTISGVCGNVVFFALHAPRNLVRLGSPGGPWNNVAIAALFLFLAAMARNQWLRAAFIMAAGCRFIDVWLLGGSLGSVLFAVLMIIGAVNTEPKLRTARWQMAAVAVILGGIALRYWSLAVFVSRFNAARPQ
ncbi:MAG TPA: hypothetical protein VGJ52_06600 [Vicinamibacterales bacterium]|jgi:hypothetical protein